MKLLDKTLTDIETETRKAYPEEMVGYILHDGTFVPQSNVSKRDKTKTFAVDALKFVELEPSIYAIVHSHTSQTHLHQQTPSLADMELASNTKKVLFISSLVNGEYNKPIKVPPEPSKEYIDRPYIFGVSDCGILIRDFYLFEFGITINIHPTKHLTAKKDWETLVTDTLLANYLRKLAYFNQIRVEGAVIDNGLLDVTQIGNLQRGDLLITSILGFVNNHVMIYLGDGLVLNQDELSCIKPLELYLNKITQVYRHPSLEKPLCV